MKDPAFLFYSKDWLEGTAELMPNEKGIYIDLLCHQHQKGDLPSDIIRLARIVGLSVSEFEPIWSVIKDKFKAIDITNDGAIATRIANEKLSDVMGDRAEKGRKNKIVGIFSGLLRKANLSNLYYKKIRSEFNIEEFNDIDSDRLSDRISEWFAFRLKSIANENATEDVNEDSLLDKGGVGEKEFKTPKGDHHFQQSEYFVNKPKWYADLPDDWSQVKKDDYWDRADAWSALKTKNKAKDWARAVMVWEKRDRKVIPISRPNLSNEDYKPTKNQ